MGCRPWGGGGGLGVEDGGCGEIKDRGAGKEFRSYILVSHSVELFQFLGPVPGLLLGNICSSTQCKRWKTQSPPTPHHSTPLKGNKGDLHSAPQRLLSLRDRSSGGSGGCDNCIFPPFQFFPKENQDNFFCVFGVSDTYTKLQAPR